MKLNEKIHTEAGDVMRICDVPIHPVPASQGEDPLVGWMGMADAIKYNRSTFSTH